jgi:paraquat-inducible protein A
MSAIAAPTPHATPHPLPSVAGAVGGLIACPVCDMLHREIAAPEGGRLRCRRCGTTLVANAPRAIDRVLAAAIASAVLIVAAVFFPFLELNAVGIERRASVLDAARAFSTGLMVPLAMLTGVVIIVTPVLRALAVAYTLLPLRLGRPPAPGARDAYRLATRLKPWCMAEIFIIGVVVALVKVGGMATLTLGPAFWALAFLVLVIVIEGVNANDNAIWLALERSAPR